MLEFAINSDEPYFIRYPRGNEGIDLDREINIELGKGEIIKEGKDITIIAIGKMVSRALEVSNILKMQNIDLEVINARFLKPLDKDLIIESANKTKKIITIEDNSMEVGLGTEVIKIINESKLKNIEIKLMGYKNDFIRHGEVKELEELYNLDVNSIVNIILKDNKKVQSII